MFINNIKHEKEQCFVPFMKMCFLVNLLLYCADTLLIFSLLGHLLNSYVRIDDIEIANLKRVAGFLK